MTQATPPEQLTKVPWQHLISEQKSSTMNQAEFCCSKDATFNNWKRKLNFTKSSPQWLELPVIGQPEQTWDIELKLPGIRRQGQLFAFTVLVQPDSYQKTIQNKFRITWSLMVVITFRAIICDQYKNK